MAFTDMVPRTARLLLGLILLAALHAYGAVPSRLSYQGRLSTKSGDAISDGAATMVFSPFSQSESGIALWSETNVVRVSEGLFATLLGEKKPLPDEAFAGPTWMEVRVNEATLSPRTELVANPYALRAKVAEAVADGAVTSSMLSAGSITGPALASDADGLAAQRQAMPRGRSMPSK